MNHSTAGLLRNIFLFGALLLALFFAAGSASAQSAAPPPDKIDRLVELLSDPDVKAWPTQQNAKAANPPPAEAGSGGDAGAMAPAEISSALDVVREHIHEMTEAVPTLPAQSSRAWTILDLEFKERG